MVYGFWYCVDPLERTFFFAPDGKEGYELKKKKELELKEKYGEKAPWIEYKNLKGYYGTVWVLYQFEGEVARFQLFAKYKDAKYALQYKEGYKLKKFELEPYKGGNKR